MQSEKVTPTRSFFRQEAIDFQRHRHWGKLVMLQPFPVTLTVWGLMALCLWRDDFSFYSTPSSSCVRETNRLGDHRVLLCIKIRFHIGE